tara:strand:- start:559 stop:768 length:210 start_codon:yes stop_codon:yes gene_type:complete
MEIAELKIIAEQLSDLACKSCTKNWLESHDNLSDPLDDIYLCFKEGLISLELKERLIREVLEINKQSIK